MDTMDYKALLKDALTRLDSMQAEIEFERQASAEARQLYNRFHEPVAVIGMGCRLPGGVKDPAGYWQLLVEGRDTSGEVPASRWDVDAYYDPDPAAPAKIYTRKGSFIDNPELFDPQFFNISPREATSLDPQQRLLLEVSWEALESANIVPANLYGSQTGVFVGISSSEYLNGTALGKRENDLLEKIDPYFGTGNAFSTATGRISYTLRLMGPNVAVDTACSSSLSAIYLACMSLRNGKCDLALAGGVNMILTPAVHITLSKARMISPDGVCKTFDAGADGYLRGEGCGMIVLKRLSDAQRDGDDILALIRGGAMNQDGASSGLTVPSGPSQQAVVRQALDDAGVGPGEISYVEAHGTGTYLGDPIEAGALAQVFGPYHDESNPLYIGAVKTNIGHLESASGIASVIKTILALQHAEIPRNLHFTQLNPNIPWDGLALHVPTSHMPWQAKRRMAGVSGFGFGGTNVHLVLEEAGAAARTAAGSGFSLRAEADPLPDLPRVLCLSARSDLALIEMARTYADFLQEANPADWPSICHTAHQHRSLFRYRLALVAANPQEAAAELRGFAAGQRSPNLFSGQPSEVAQPRLAFLFTGQGAQYVGMGRDLYAAEPVFRQYIDTCSALLGRLGDYTLLDVLFPTEAQQELIHATTYTQPALFALEYALGKLLESWGIQAEVMMGHSIGEYAAACLAGVFSLEDGLRLVAARGQLMGSLPQGGRMISVFASPAQVEDALAALKQAHGVQEIAVAAVNAPENVVVSGAAPALEALRAILEQQGVRSEALQVSHAFHSPLMEPILAQFCSVAGEVTYHAPAQRLISNLHGRLAGEEDMRSAAYWGEHIRQGVQFMGGMQSMQQLGVSIYLELGPRPALIGLGKECLGAAAPDVIWTPTLRPAKSDRMQLAACLAQLFAAGYPVSWQVFDRRGGANGGDLTLRRISLPTYTFQRQRYWIDYTEPDSAAGHKEAEPHPLLGAALDLAGAPGMYFENSIGLHSPAYLEDHRLFHEPVFPGAAFVEMSLAAGRAFFAADQGLSIQGARIEQPLIFTGSERVSVQTALRPQADGAVEINIYSRSPQQTGWLRHFTAVLRSGSFPPPPDAPTLAEALAGAAQSDPADLAAFYFRRSLQGFDYGRAFQGLESVRRIPSETGTAYFVTARLPEALQAQAPLYTWHPAVLDALLQPLADQTTDPGRLPLPVAFEHLTLHLPPARVASSKLDVCMQIGAPDTAAAEIPVRFYFYNPEGILIASATGQIIAVERMAFFRLLNKGFGGWFYYLDWAALDAPAPGAEQPNGRGEWLICADDEGVADRLAERLLANGDGVTLVVPPQEPPAIGQNAGGPRRLTLDPLDVGGWQTLVQGLQNRPLKGIIHLWNLSVRQPLDGPAANLPDHQALGVGSLLHLVQACSQERGVRVPRLWLVTRGAWMVKPEQQRLAPLHAAALGLGRGIYFEHNEYELVSLDLDPDSGDLDLDANFLYQQLQHPDAEDLLALRAGQRWGLRLKPGWTRQAQRPLGKAFHLAIGEYGLLEFLHLAPLERRAPGPDEVEVEVRAAGLNLRDVLNALGMLRQFAAELGIENAQNLPFGGECAGVITALGANAVGRFRVGEEVIAGMAPGSLASHVNARLDAVMRKPAHLSFEEAATLPTVSLTVYYGLHVLAHIQPGERVLIHAAAGGVGQAALQYAQRMGAEVFATASPGKWDFLRAQGVAHIYNSRSLDFREQILADTGGEGVQIVLNSLAGEFIPASLAVLAAGGRFVEIGKLGIMTPEFFAEHRPDAAYYPFDLMEIAISKPELLRQLFGELHNLWAEGVIQPLPRTVFPITEAEAAFRFMAQARHTGKVVIVPPPPPVKIRSDAAYLITGGLGGLGLQVAGWLVYQGARRLVLVGRSGAVSPEAQAGVAALRALGAEVQTVACDVSDSAAVERLLSEITAPLAGVIHAAGVTGTGLIRQHTWAEFFSQTRPKILGAWNLHTATLGTQLDFFVCFSSIGALVCSPGQSSYAAGNLFMDALMQARRAAGYPGTTINWGPWAEVGMVPRLEAHLQQGQIASGLHPFSNAAGRMAFEAVMERICMPGRLADERTVPGGVEQALVVAVDWNKLVAFAPQTAGAPVFGALITATPGGGRQRGELFEKLKSLPVGERKPFLFKVVQEALSTILNLPAANIEPHQRLLDFGMDSLMAIEFKNNLEISLACTLPATVVFDYPTVGGVTDFLLDGLLQLDADPVSSVPAALSDIPAVIPADISAEFLAEVLDEVEGLSESEAALRLNNPNSEGAA